MREFLDLKGLQNRASGPCDGAESAEAVWASYKDATWAAAKLTAPGTSQGVEAPGKSQYMLEGLYEHQGISHNKSVSIEEDTWSNMTGV